MDVLARSINRRPRPLATGIRSGLLKTSRSATGTRKPYHCSTDFQYHQERVPQMTISASEARKDLFPLIKRVNDDHTPVRISSKNGDAVLMSAQDYDSWQETVYLLRSPANARSLMEAVARDRSGETVITRTMAELEELAGDG